MADNEIGGPERRLRIAFVLDKFLPSRGGERYFLFLMDELLKRGHEVHIFAAEVEGADKRITYHLVPVWKHPRSLRMLTFLRNSRSMVSPHKFDIVHGIGGTLVLNVLNPIGGVEQAYLKQEFASIEGKPYYLYKLIRRYLSLRHYIEIWIQKRLYRKEPVAKMIAISDMVKQDMITYHGVSEDRIALVFNSVDLSRFSPENRNLYRDDKRKELGIDAKDTVLFTLGNNYRLKGIRPLIRAFALLKRRYPDQPLKLLVAGRGQIVRYRFHAWRLGVSDSVHFLGPITGAEHYYAASDIYVHPTFYDSCSLVVLEALASGLPVVTTKTNGAAQAIESDTAGIVVDDPSDVRSLADAISAFLDPKKRKNAIAAARSMAERYPPERNIADTLKLYHQVAGREAS
jgi:UDP-glucose:(heptosyl)LPS alpha-1,3-glucosyltransferase